MLESGSSGSVRGVLSNEHPYREPGPKADTSPTNQTQLPNAPRPQPTHQGSAGVGTAPLVF